MWVSWGFALFVLTRRKNTQTTRIQVQNYKHCASYVSYIHISHTKCIVLDLFYVCSNFALLNYSGQKSKNNLCMILTYVWPWNKVKIIKLGINWSTLSRVIIVQSLKDCSETVLAKKPTVFLSDQERHQLFPLNICKSEKNSGIFYYVLDLHNNPTKFQLS